MIYPAVYGFERQYTVHVDLGIIKSRKLREDGTNGRHNIFGQRVSE